MRLRLFLTAWVVFSLFFSTNVAREHYPAFSLIEQGNFQVDRYQGFHSDIFVHRDGHSYIGNNVASSVVAAGPLWVFKPVLDALEAYSKDRLEKNSATVDTEYRTKYPMRKKMFALARQKGLELRLGAATFVTSVLLMAPLSALMVVGIFQILVGRGVASATAAWLAILFGLATPLLYRTAHLNNNAFVMYATFACFVLLWRGLETPGPLPTGRLLLAGFCAGLTLAFDYSGMVPLLCLYAYLVLGRLSSVTFWKSVVESIPFILGSVPPVLFLLFTQWVMFGNPFLPGQSWMPDVNYTDSGWRGFAWPSADLLWMNLLHPSYGMLAFAPFLILGLIPVLAVPTGQLVLGRRERLLATGIILAFLVFCAANQYSRMQWNSGFRYLLPLLPFVFLAACDYLVRLPRWAFAAVAGVSLFHSFVLCAVRDCHPATDTWRHSADFRLWLSEIGQEAVPASYEKLWNEGVQLPWLSVLRLTSLGSHPLIQSPWLPAVLFALAGLLILGIWKVANHQNEPEDVSGNTEARSMKPAPTVDVVVPVLNEAHVLEKSIGTLRSFLHQKFPYPARIIVADNGSRDGTSDIARKLAVQWDDVRVIALPQKGRGRALRAAWTQSDADIVAYMDVDLSTELEALEKLCRGIHEDGYGIGTGSRLKRGAQVTRSFKREFISRAYNLFLKCVLFTRFSDAQCGFKAVSRRVVEEIIPLIKDQAWFFDTELLVLGEKLGFKILDIPVRWVEDPDSRVKIVSTAWEDIKGVFRLRWLLWSGRLRSIMESNRAARQSGNPVPQAEMASYVRSPG